MPRLPARACALAAALACALASVTAAAQTAGAAAAPATSSPTPGLQRLSLADVYRLALQNDALLRAARAAAEARRERVPQARAQLLPNVSATASRFRHDLETTSPGLGGEPVTRDLRYSSSSRVLTLRQPIYRPFHLADLRQARAQAEEANATLEREVQNLAVRVTTAYLQALAAEDQLALVLAQKTAYTTQLESARRRMEGGAGTRTDIDEAQARLDLAIAQELEARQNLGFTRQQLQLLVGVDVPRVASLDERRLPLAPLEPADAQFWIARAEETSPEVRAGRAQVEAARQEVQKARAGHLPTLDAIAQLSKNESESITSINQSNDQKSIGLQLNVPIFAGGYVSSQVRQARAELERAEQSLEALRRDLALRVHKEYRGVTEGVSRVRALEQAVRSAETVVQSTRRSFEAGVRTVVDILNAEEQRAAAVRDLSEARYTYLLSRIRLRALSGQADIATIEEANGWMTPP